MLSNALECFGVPGWLKSLLSMSAGEDHVVLLRSNGTAVAFGENECLQCNIPALSAKLRYIQVSAGAGFTILLRSDGTAVEGRWHSCGIRGQ